MLATLPGPGPRLRGDPRRRSSGRGAAVWGLLLAVLFAAGWPFAPDWPFEPGWAAAADGPFRLEKEIPFDEEILAVGINADEALIAVALEAGGGEVDVRLLDRRSGAALGSLHGEPGASPRLAFAPDRDQLLLWGEDALELWEVPVGELRVDALLAEEHRLWRQTPVTDGPIFAAAFAAEPPGAVWREGAALYFREAKAESSAPETPLLEGEGAPGGIALHPTMAALAAYAHGDKRIALYAGNPAQPQGALTMHRFPVSAMGYSPGGKLVSLDSGRNLIAWSGDRQAQQMDFLQALPAGAQPVALSVLSGKKILVLWREGDQRHLAAVEGAKRQTEGALEVPPAGLTAISPTGRYILTGVDETLRTYAFARPVSPVDYVRQLRERGAYQTAFTYARMLDPEGLSSAGRREIEQELNRAPVDRVLAEYAQRLREALREEEPAAVAEWAGRIAELDPGNAEAVQALARLDAMRDRQVLAEAQESYDAGQYRKSIELLSSRIGAASEHYTEANQLILLAERKRDVDNTLGQARQKMELELYAAAETLVNEALRLEPESATGLALQAEIDSRSGGTFRRLGALGTGMALALVIVGGLMYRFRASWLGWLRPLSLESAAPLRKPPPAGGAAGRRPADMDVRQRREEAARRDRAARAHLRTAVRLSEVAEVLEKTEDMLQSCRQADRGQHQTAYLLALEAELNTLGRRLNESSADPERLVERLNTIRAELRNLKFGTAHPQSEATEAPEATEDGDYYQLLQVPSAASGAEIKAAYHRLIKQYHPDRHSESEFGWIRSESERMSRRLSEAYQVLSDAARRRRYDRELAKRRGAAE